MKVLLIIKNYIDKEINSANKLENNINENKSNQINEKDSNKPIKADEIKITNLMKSRIKIPNGHIFRNI